MSLFPADAVLRDICIIALVNNTQSLAQNLMASNLVARHGVPVHVEEGAASAAIGYNRGLDATGAPIVIFAHQDVYFPPDWHHKLAAAIAEVEAQDPDWGIIAPFGMCTRTAAHLGDVWSTSLSKRVGQPVTTPQPVQSVDELVIILRRSSGLRFDPDLPRYHLYGVDIVQQAIAAGKSAVVADLPVVHNDSFHDRLRHDFTESYRFIRRKWRAVLPLRSPVLWIDKMGLGLPIYRLRAWRSIERRRAMAGDTTTDPRIYSAQCGWEDQA